MFVEKTIMVLTVVFRPVLGGVITKTIAGPEPSSDLANSLEDSFTASK